MASTSDYPNQCTDQCGEDIANTGGCAHYCPSGDACTRGCDVHEDERTPIVWDQHNPSAWLNDMGAETARHRAALTAQWPTDMRIGYFHGQSHMVPADQTFDEWGPIIPLCGTIYHGMSEMETVQATPCRLCTAAYNGGATTGVKPDPAPVGATVEFDTLLGAETRTMRGVVVESPVPTYIGFRRVQVNPAGLCTDVRVENLRVVS